MKYDSTFDGEKLVFKNEKKKERKKWREEKNEICQPIKGIYLKATANSQKCVTFLIRKPKLHISNMLFIWSSLRNEGRCQQDEKIFII